MEPTLIAVTLLSLAMAVAMSAVAWRLLREERRRSDARVATLAALAGRDRPVPTRGDDLRHGFVPARATPPRPARASVPLDLPLRPVADDTSAPRAGAAATLFAASAPPARSGARALAFALVALAMAAGLGVAWQIGGRPGQAQPATAAAPLELLSLGYDRQNDALRITGLVKNPRTGQDIRGVVAVAFLFDRAGTFIASGSAPLDFTRLEPGDQSPFVVVVPNAGHVARYRLSFRASDGRVLGHVDRRSDSATADRDGAATPGPAGLAASVARPQ